MKKYYIGVDIGTTSTKAVIFEKNGNPVVAKYSAYNLYSPNATISEQQPHEIFSAVLTSIKQAIAASEISPNQIALIAFSCAMHSILAVDKTGEPLTNSITWADRRAYNYAINIQNSHQIYSRTGAFVNAASPFCKLLWLKNEQPEIFANAHKFISIKEYVFYRLFGEYVVDYSIAAASGMFNMSTLNWDFDLLVTLGISPNKLSQIVPTTFVMEEMSEEHAQFMGISPKTPVVIGSTDGTLSNLGVNAIDNGVVAITVGTSAAIRTVVSQPFTDSLARTFCYPLTEKHWVIGGALNGAGVSLQWFCNNFCESELEISKATSQDVYEILTEKAEKIAPGADGLFFHPSLAGERNPLKAINMRGSFWGLDLHHTKSHLIRAVLEGVIFNLCTILSVIEENVTSEITQVQATGGFARSVLWRQIMADILGKKIVVPQSFESSCLGAVVLGQVALNEISDISAVANMVGKTHEHTPNPQNFEQYKKIIPIYLQLYKIFLEEYANIKAVI
ncbi:MAG: FGGY family carbohydrate kinase [Firmicutes bacterium]|nr:FGGY family carbohydrate kinase [Bacillota bacterium]